MRIGRNDPCTCGSGKKYKKCCLQRHKQEQQRPLQGGLTHFSPPEVANQPGSPDEPMAWVITKNKIALGLAGAYDTMISLHEPNLPKGNVYFHIDGYNDDSREIFEIAEIRQFFLWLILLDPKRFFALCGAQPHEGSIVEVQFVSMALGLITEGGGCIPLFAEWAKAYLLKREWPEVSNPAHKPLLNDTLMQTIDHQIQTGEKQIQEWYEESGFTPFS